MIAVKVQCDTGNSWVTSINGTFEDACNYFMGQTFVREDNAGIEIADTVTDVQLVG